MQDRARRGPRSPGGDYPDRRGARRSPARCCSPPPPPALWTGPAVVPAALAVALIVFGGYLALAPRRRLARSVPRSRAPRHPLLRRPARARPRHRPRRPRPRRATPPRRRQRRARPTATALRYRLTREARLNGVAAEETARRRHRIVVTRAGARALLWRIERRPAAAAGAPASRDAGVPWLRLDAGRARSPSQRRRRRARATATPTLDARPRRPAAPPRRRPPSSPAPARRCAPCVLAGADGRRDLLLMPLDGAEISGLVPDHFLDELPGRARPPRARGPAHLRQPRRPPAPRRARAARRRHRRR